MLLIEDMYRDSTTAVRTKHCDTESFEVSVGLHQGSVLSLYLFIIFLDEIAKSLSEQGSDSNLELLYADDLVITGNSKDKLERRLEEWRSKLETHGLRISRRKTVLLSTMNGEEIELQGEQLASVDAFRYLGTILYTSAESSHDMKGKMQAGWNNWRKITGVLCDKKILLCLKSKIFKTVVRPAMLYHSELWAPKAADLQSLQAAEMRMLRWTLGKTRKDHIKNEDVRRRLMVEPIGLVIETNRRKWFGHILRRPNNNICKKVWSKRPVTNRRGQAKTSW